MNLSGYGGKLVQVTDPEGRVFTGTAGMAFPGGCPPESGSGECCLRVSGHLFRASDIARIEEMPGLAVIRATETWQRAGAYYVRIQAMAKKHHITLDREFDVHDTPETKYIVVTDSDFPVATARMYPLDGRGMMIGRVVVLPEYRRRGIGTMVVLECEKWARELGFSTAVVESRDNKVRFYRQMDYVVRGEPRDGDTFRCVRMEKPL